MIVGDGEDALLLGLGVFGDFDGVGDPTFETDFLGVFSGLKNWAFALRKRCGVVGVGEAAWARALRRVGEKAKVASLDTGDMDFDTRAGITEYSMMLLKQVWMGHREPEQKIATSNNMKLKSVFAVFEIEMNEHKHW